MWLRHIMGPTFGVLGLALIAWLTLNGWEHLASRSVSGAAVPAVSESQTKLLTEMNGAAEALYRYAIEGKLDEGRIQLANVERSLKAITFEGLTTLEGMKELTAAVDAGKRAFARVGIVPNEIMHTAAAIRLSVDALAHPKQPIWIQYYKPITSDTGELKEAIDRKDIKNARAAFTRLQSHYAVIRPAVWVSRAPAEAERIDSLFVFYKKRLEKEGAVPWSEMAPVIEHLQTSWNVLFGQPSRDQAAFAPLSSPREPLLFIAVIGSFIISVLTYVGWRRYESERDYVPVKKESQIHRI